MSSSQETPKPQEARSVAPPQPTIPDEVRDQITQILTNILMLASDLAFDLAEVEDENIRKSPIFKKAREIVREVKKLRDLMLKLRR